MKRDEPSARRFFQKAIEQHGIPEKVVIDKSGTNEAALEMINLQICFVGMIGCLIEVLQIKHLNNLVEQSHRLGCRNMTISNQFTVYIFGFFNIVGILIVVTFRS